MSLYDWKHAMRMLAFRRHWPAGLLAIMQQAVEATAALGNDDLSALGPVEQKRFEALVDSAGHDLFIMHVGGNGRAKEADRGKDIADHADG